MGVQIRSFAALFSYFSAHWPPNPFWVLLESRKLVESVLLCQKQVYRKDQHQFGRWLLVLENIDPISGCTHFLGGRVCKLDPDFGIWINWGRESVRISPTRQLIVRRRRWETGPRFWGLINWEYVNLSLSRTHLTTHRPQLIVQWGKSSMQTTPELIQIVFYPLK